MEEALATVPPDMEAYEDAVVSTEAGTTAEPKS